LKGNRIQVQSSCGKPLEYRQKSDKITRDVSQESKIKTTEGENMESIDIIRTACTMILDNKINNAKILIEENYKHNFIKYETRSMSNAEKLRIYLEDGFIDRYTGKRLLFPNILRILTKELGDVFPFHKNWKMSDCHIAYWEYMPTHDHIVPIARGGRDIPENIVTTSQKINSMKSNFLMEELGLKLFEKGNLENWDGMISWYVKYIKTNNRILEDNYINNWHNALLKCQRDGYIKL
jgi:hypothetical protein